MSKINIAVVDSESEIREILKTKIDAEEGMVCVDTYASAEEALSYLPSKKPQVVIMDIGLPKMNGIECMMRIKLKHPEIQFLMFTIYIDDDHIFDALKAGANGYILKGNGSAGIIAAIYELLAGGAPMSKIIATKVLTEFRYRNPKNNTVKNLTPRQTEILLLLTNGFTYKEVANQLSPPITVKGVKQHIYRIYKKLT